MGPSGRNGHGLFAPMMDALVVYRSSHSPFRRLHDSALAFGFRRSSVTASASMASLSASVAGDAALDGRDGVQQRVFRVATRGSLVDGVELKGVSWS